MHSLSSHHFPRYTLLRRALSQRRRGAVPWLWCLVWFVVGGAANRTTAQAQAAGGKILIRKEGALPADLQYWFVNRMGSATKARPLPAAPSGGVIALEVPPAYRGAGAELRVLDTRQGKVARLPLSPETSGGPNASAPNLLANPDFSRNAEHWTLEKTGPANATLQVVNAANPLPETSGKVARFQIETLGKESWHVQFHQVGLDLREGEVYTLTFWARADHLRPLAVHANINAEDGHGIGLTADAIPLTTEWRKFRYAFTATRTLPQHNRLTFLLGDAVGVVELTGLTLQSGRAGVPEGENLLQNGDFVRGAEHWTTQSDPPPARATMQWLGGADTPPEAPGKLIRFQIETLGKEIWHVQFYQTGLDLREGEIYTLTFWARADRPRPISLVGGIDRPDWHSIGLDCHLPVRTAWQKHVVTFTATHAEREHGRLAFVLGEALGTVELARVTLQHNAEVAPGSGPAAQSLSAADFVYAQHVEIPITYRGRAVESAQVTLRNGENAPQTYALRATDAGVARFADVPLDTKLEITVACGDQKADFERTLAPDRPGKVVEIVLPDSWNEVKTLSGASASAHPLIGVWQSRATSGASALRFTFNADGTGSIQPGAAQEKPESPPRAPVVNAFRWHLAEGKQKVAIGSRIYTWAIQEAGGQKALRLTDRNGKTHVLYRRSL